MPRYYGAIRDRSNMCLFVMTLMKIHVRSDMTVCIQEICSIV